MSSFDDALEFRFKADTTWRMHTRTTRRQLQGFGTGSIHVRMIPPKFLAEYNQYFGNDSPFAWYLITDYFMAVDNRAKT